jgi:hypothetical protein
MNISVLVNSFIGGETSPLLAGRVDSQAYAMGAKRMENMIPMITGGARKRPGTLNVDVGDQDENKRPIEWPLFGGEVALVLITTQRIEINVNGFFFVFDERYSNVQISELKYVVSPTSIWIVHQSVRPFRITWNGEYFSADKPDFTGKDFAAEGDRPSCVAFYGGRLCFAGTYNEPNRIYMSRPPDSMTGEDRYTDFTAGDNPSDAIILEKNDMQGGRIQWLASGKRLFAATDRSVWADNGEVPTPAAFDMNIISYGGANELQSKGSKEIMVYAGRGGKSLRAIIWSQNGENGGYVDIDLSRQAAHLFSSGIKDFAVADYPFPIIWAVTGDGLLVSCTIDLASGIIAFARHPTAGTVRYIEVVKKKEGDALYLFGFRNFATTGIVSTLEYIAMEDLMGADYNESNYVDSGRRFEYDTPTDIVSTPPFFNGMRVNVFADGSPVLNLEVDLNGILHLPFKARKVYIGLPYKSVLSPNPPQIPANGTSLGKKRRLEQVKLKLFRSLGGKAGTDEEKAEAINTRRFGSYELGTPPEPYTGDVDITVSGNTDPEGSLVIVHEEPTPFTVLALVERIAVLEA